jgi:hypothetical protein
MLWKAFLDFSMIYVILSREVGARKEKTTWML